MDKKVKKFIIEVEEGRSECDECPFDFRRCAREGLDEIDCSVINLATMKIKEYDKESNTKTS